MKLLVSWLLPLIAMLAAPLLIGLINRTKALVGGRRGAPLLQPYRDIRKLLARGAVYSDTGTWVLQLGPVANLAGLVLALLVVPLAGVRAPIAFPGDLVVVAGLLGLGRFLTLLAALDTGSSFEGMGASREAYFGALSEPALFLALAALVRVTGELSLSGAYARVDTELWANAFPVLALIAVTFLALELIENSRMPVDDPTTHLELTMIHEVMVLDHSGPDLGFIHYGAALKLWLIGALLIGIAVPVRSGNSWLDLLAGLAGLTLLAVLIGAIESLFARMRLAQTPQFIVAAGAFAAVALVMALR